MATSRCICGEKPSSPQQESCQQCGTLLHAGDAACENHPESSAAGRCVICGKPMCFLCRATVDGPWTCAPDVQILSGWNEIFRSWDPHAADAILRNLILNGYDARSYDRAQYADDPHNVDGYLVRVFVRNERLTDASHFLRQLDLDRIDEVDNRIRKRRAASSRKPKQQTTAKRR